MADTDVTILVDEYDNIVGHKVRGQLTKEDRWRIIGVWIENNEGDILLAKRHPSKKIHPGLWGPAAAGTLEKGETYTSTAYRELEEEIGLTGVELTEVYKDIFDNPEGDKRICAWYKATCDWPIEKFKLQADEVEAVKWISKNTLIKDLQTHPELYVPTASYWQKIFL